MEISHGENAGREFTARLEGRAPVSPFSSHAMTFLLPWLAVATAHVAAREETESVFRSVPRKLLIVLIFYFRTFYK